LDAITAPLNEAGTVLGKMAVNDYTTAMTGDYQGQLKDFAGQINQVQQHLLSVQDLFIRVAQGDISRLEEYRAGGKQSENDQLVPAVDGTEIVNQTVAALEQMATDVSQAVDLVAGIGNALNEQATSIIQINQGIDQVAAVTQNTTATSEESASAGEALLGQAEEFRRLVSKFRLSDSKTQVV
jgi:methyl-accepting chemotaxis protein